MRQQSWGALAIVALVASACTTQKESARPRPSFTEAGGTSAPESAASAIEPRFLSDAKAVSAFQARTAQPGQERESPQIPGERKLIRKGEMTVEVSSVTAALTRLAQIISSAGGQTANQSERQDEYGSRTASVTCRVPAERLDAAVEAVKTLGSARTLTLTAEDVTTDYFDVGVRINTQTQLERQLVAILQRPTNRLSDLLKIERELARVREEIDRLQGRRRSWDNQIALSSLVITLEEPAPVVAGTGGGLLRTLGESFGEAVENAVLAVAGIIATAGSILPVALLVGAVGWMAVRLRRRRRAQVAPAV